MTIYSTESQPYFYIIQHTPTGLMYAGCRWKVGCNPSELLKDGGYLTSSKKIKSLIQKDGLNSFKIIDIILEEDILIPFGWNSIKQFETHFLNFNNCAESNLWLNGHNNTIYSHADLEFKIIMINYYNVDNAMKSEQIKEKVKKTNLKKYGVECTLQSDIVLEKIHV